MAAEFSSDTEAIFSIAIDTSFDIVVISWVASVFSSTTSDTESIAATISLEASDIFDAARVVFSASLNTAWAVLVISLNAPPASFARATPDSTSEADSSIAFTASLTVACMPCISAAISLVAKDERSASLRTSSATTAKPLPCSPARAASMAALSAKRLV